jgi:hypothetical protein
VGQGREDLKEMGVGFDGRCHPTNWYEEPGQIQADLDRFMEYYNLERTHQGYRLKGRTPAQALREALGVDTLPSVTQPAGDLPEAA